MIILSKLLDKILYPRGVGYYCRKIEIDGFVNNVKDIEHHLPLEDILNWYNVYTGPIIFSNANEIVNELNEGNPADVFHLKMGDWISVEFVEDRFYKKYIMVTSITPYINKEVGFFKEVEDIPRFSIRKKMIYGDGIYYPSFDNSDKTPQNIEVWIKKKQCRVMEFLKRIEIS